MAKRDASLVLLNNSLERVSRKKDYYQRFDSIEHWYFIEREEILNKELRYLEHIKSIVIKKYWQQDIYISPAALDDIIFHAIKSYDKEKILDEIDNLIQNSNLNKNSIVIFPLHSFGFKYGGLKHFSRLNFSYKTHEFQIFPQTNSFETSRKNVLNYLNDIDFPNREKFDIDLFEHFYKSRALKWFDRNPVMILHFKFSQIERFDNLRFIIQKINFITNKLYFLSALGNIEDKTGTSFSTRNSNNWETLDIKHFLTITPFHNGSELNCIPVHFSHFMIYEKMHMNIDLLLKQKPSRNWERRAIDCIDNLYNGYIRYVLKKEPSFAKFFRIANSLDYFRRSIKSINIEDKIININIAFECLLLDRQEGKKKEKMIDRLWKSLRGKINRKTNLKNIEVVITERNEIIHNGHPANAKIEFKDIYKTYCKFILYLHDNINRIDSTKPNYLTEYYEGL